MQFGVCASACVCAYRGPSNVAHITCSMMAVNLHFHAPYLLLQLCLWPHPSTTAAMTIHVKKEQLLLFTTCFECMHQSPARKVDPHVKTSGRRRSHRNRADHHHLHLTSLSAACSRPASFLIIRKLSGGRYFCLFVLQMYLFPLMQTIRWHPMTERALVWLQMDMLHGALQ